MIPLRETICFCGLNSTGPSVRILISENLGMRPTLPRRLSRRDPVEAEAGNVTAHCALTWSELGFGSTAYLVKAQHVKNISGRKNDVIDRQRLQQLMNYSMLSGAFGLKEEKLCLEIEPHYDLQLQRQS